MRLPQSGADRVFAVTVSILSADSIEKDINLANMRMKFQRSITQSPTRTTVSLQQPVIMIGAPKKKLVSAWCRASNILTDCGLRKKTPAPKTVGCSTNT